MRSWHSYTFPRFFLILGLAGVIRFLTFQTLDIITGSHTLTVLRILGGAGSIAVTAIAWSGIAYLRDNVDKANDQPH